MIPGDVLAGRYRLERQLDGEPDLQRWLAIDNEEQRPVEVLVLRATRGADARATFEAAHQHLQRAAPEPALLRTRAVLRVGRQAAIVRPLAGESTVHGVPGGKLTGPEVAAIGAHLLPAVVAAGSSTSGALLPDDVLIDAAGQPVLAPRGRPVARLRPGDAAWAAPEAFDGAQPDGAAGLYGLGVLLYRLLTGKMPTGSAPPPPSSLRRSIASGVDEAVLGLLSADPSRRAAALPLLQEHAGRMPDLTHLVGTEPADAVKLFVSPRHRQDTGSAGVMIRNVDLKSLDPAQVSAAAGVSGLSVEDVEDITAAGTGLLLETTPNLRRANARAEDLEREYDLPTTATGPGWGCVPLTGSAIGALTTLIAGVSGALLMATPPLGFILLGFCAIAGFITLFLGARWWRQRGFDAEARHTNLATATRRAAWRGDADAERILAEVARVRRMLATRDLPGAAAADLRGALRAIEQRLEGMRRVGVVAHDALSNTSLPEIRTRLEAVSHQGREEERDKLARTLADLEAIDRRRADLARDYERIETTLAEVATTLSGAVAGDLDEGAALLARGARELAAAGEEPLPREPIPEGSTRRPDPRGVKERQ